RPCRRARPPNLSNSRDAGPAAGIETSPCGRPPEAGGAAHRRRWRPLTRTGRGGGRRGAGMGSNGELLRQQQKSGGQGQCGGTQRWSRTMDTSVAPEQATEFTKQYSQIIARTWVDEAFKQRLIADPNATLRELGWEPPEGVELRTVENTDHVVYLI